MSESARGHIVVRRKAKDGHDGKGVSFVTISYAISDSATRTPIDGWQSVVPEVIDNYYLWTRTVITYTDGTTSTSYSVAKSGKGIKTVIVQYAASASGTTPPSSGWQLNIPVVAAGNYLWTRTSTTYTDNTNSVSYSVSRNGTNGTNGQDGAPGRDGQDGAPGRDGQDGAPGRDGQDGAPGATGPRGYSGCAYRITVWQNGKEYRNDSSLETNNIKYIDIAVDVPIAIVGQQAFHAYMCKVTHTSSSSKPLGHSTYWTEMTSIAPMITPLLIASAISADYINVGEIAANSTFVQTLVAQQAFIESLVVKYLDTNPSASGNKIRINGDEIIMYDSSGNKKVRVFNGSVGDYDDMFFEASGDYRKTPITRNKVFSQYLPASGTHIYYNDILARINLGFFDAGSQIIISDFYLTFTLPYLSGGGVVTCGFNAPGLALKLMRDGNAVSTTYLGPNGGSYNSGSTITAEFPATTVTHNVTVEGNYSIEIRPNSSNTFWFQINTGSSGTVSGISVTSRFYIEFTRDNYQYTHIGNDGLMQVMGTGFMFSNKDAFVVRRGSYMLRVTNTGIQKSVNDGITWTSL